VSVFRPQLSASSSLRFQSLDERAVEGGGPLERDAASRPPRLTPRQTASPQLQGQEPRTLPTTHAIHIDEAASVEDGAVGRGLVEPGERERGSMLEGDTPQPRSALRFSHHHYDDHQNQQQQQQHYEEEESCVTSTSHTEDPPPPLPAAAAAAAANSSGDSRSGRQVKGASTDVTHRQQGIVVPVEVYSEQQETIRVLRLQVSELQREVGVLKLQLHQQHRQEGVSDKVSGAIDGHANSDVADDNNDVDDQAFKDVDFDDDNGKSQKPASLVYSSEPFRSEKSPNYEHEYEHEHEHEEEEVEEEGGGAMFMEAPSLLDLSQFVLLRGPTGANA
jgi:hypothetical protein